MKVDKTTKVGSKYAYELDGMFKSYNVNSKGVITSLTAHTAYNTNTGDALYLAGDGLNKVSADYTVIIDTKASGKNATITCDEKATFYYVDKDGKITEITYKNVTKDENDKVYAFVDDYMVKQLVVFEVKDTAPAAGTFDPADPKTAGIVGTTVVVPTIDGTPVDNAANVLAKNGYTVTGMFGTPATYWAVKNGTTYFFTESNPVYWTTTVDGVVVEYKPAGATGTVTAAKFNTSVGKGYIWNAGSGDNYVPYTALTPTTAIDGIADKAVVIKTGYVGVTNSISGAAGRTIAVADHAKVNSTFTVKATYTSAVAANEEVVLTYDGTKTVTGVADTARKVFTFAVPAGVADVTLNSINEVATYTVAAPTVTGLTDGKINGLTVTAVADKTSAKSGETVTVTVTIKGQATAGTKLTTDAGYWDGTSSQELSIPNNTNYATAHTVIYTFTVSANATPTITAANA